MITFLSYWGPVVLWAGVIFFLSSIPSLNSGFGIWDYFLRKGAHIFEFFLLTILLQRAVKASFKMVTFRGVMVLSGLVAVFYAMSDEFHQSFVPGRGPSAYDVMIDSVGIVIGLCLFQKYSKRPV